MTGQELAQYYVQIIPSADGIGGKIVSAIEKDDPGTKAGNDIGNKIKKAIAAIGIGKIVSQALKSGLQVGGELEQSIGGIEQIFGQGSKATEQLKKNAQEAFSFAQISANDYMQQVTSYSARLLQGLDGDTEAAVKYADMAIRQMSDNANTFGSDITTLQSAYQGFSRQNWTMLDNLRLGYGGTASEMARLINDSGVMGKNFTATAKNINNISFDKIIEAIQVVQDEMNITGKSSAEASQTIQGSAAALRSAWTNLFADIAIGEDASVAMQGLATTFTDYARNIIKATLNIVKGLPAALTTVIGELAPEFLASGAEIINSMAEGIAAKIPEMVSNVGTMISNFITNLTTNAGPLLNAGGELVVNIVKGIVASLPNMITAAGQILKSTGDAIVKGLPDFLRFGGRMISEIVKGIINAIPDVLTAIGEMCSNMVSNIGNVDWAGTATALLIEFREGLNSVISTVLDVFGNMAKDAIKKITDSNWFKAGADILSGIINGITSNVARVLESVGNLATNIWNTITGKNWKDVGKQISEGMANGINENGGTVTNAAASVAKNAYNGARGFLQIQSPSKLFEEVGKFVDLGFAEGIENNMKPVYDAMNTFNGSIDPFTNTDLYTAPMTPGTTSTNNFGGININIYGEGREARDIAEEVNDLLMNQILTNKAVYNV